MGKLNQILAVEKGIKSAATSQISEAYKTVQKPALFEGFAKSYEPMKEDGVKLPPESKRVQFNATDLLRSMCNVKAGLYNVTATKDYANCSARADVVVDGVKLVENAPVTYLLFLEKELTDMHTFVNALPVLSPEEKWSLDENSGLNVTSELVTTRSEKVTDVLVLLAPTQYHPGQAQAITKDVVAGSWKTVKQSGAMPAPRKAQLLEKVVKLQQAVKYAREQANMTEAPKVEAGDKVFSWLLG